MAGKAAGGLVPAGFVAHLPQPDLTKETFCEWNCDLYSYDPASESPPRPPGALSVPQCPPIVIPPVRPYDGQQAILVAARDKTPGLSDILLTAYQRGIRHAVRQLYLSRAHAQNERGRDRDNRPDGADEGETLPAQKSSEKGFASSAFSAAVEFLDVVGSILPWLKSTPITSVALFSVAPSWSISPVRACGWHRHLPRLAVAMPDNSIRLYDFTVHRFVHSPLRHASQRDVTCIEWRPLAGATFAAGGAEGIVLWKVSGWTSSRLTANGSAVGAVTSSTLTLRGHAPVVAMAWSPDGRYLASGSPNDSRVVIWDVTTQQRTVLRRGGDGGITCLAWSPCGTRVFAASDSGAFRVWETQNWTCDRWAPTPGAGRCKTAAWSPNGRVILFAFERSPRVYALTFDLPAPATDGRTVIAIDCAPTHVTATVNTNRHASPEPGDDAGSASSGPSADVTSGAALPKSPRSPGRPSRATEGFTPSVRAASEGDRRRKYREELNAYMRARGGLPVPESRVDAYRQVYDPLFYLYLKAYGIEDLMERREREMYPFLDDPLTNATALTADQRRQLERILDNAVVVKGRRAPNPLTSDIISAGGNDDDNDADGSIRGVSPVGSNSASRLTSARIGRPSDVAAAATPDVAAASPVDVAPAGRWRWWGARYKHADHGRADGGRFGRHGNAICSGKPSSDCAWRRGDNTRWECAVDCVGCEWRAPCRALWGCGRGVCGGRCCAAVPHGHAALPRDCAERRHPGSLRCRCAPIRFVCARQSPGRPAVHVPSRGPCVVRPNGVCAHRRSVVGPT
eukprot:Opistho-2@65405